MLRAVCFIILLVSFQSCDSTSSGGSSANVPLRKYLEGKPVYLIQTGPFISKDSAKAAAAGLENKVDYNIYIQKYFPDKSRKETDSSKKYTIQIGKFNSSFQAGEIAYDLSSKGIIPDYEIIKNRETVFNNFADIFFIGKSGNSDGIFKGNIFSKKTYKVWNNPAETVADLDYSPTKGKAFFITVSEVGYNGILPFIKKAKLYMMDELQNIKLIKNFGDCIQLFSHWESPDFYRIVILSFDKKNPMRVIENNLAYNEMGVAVNEESKAIDLGTENYPRITGIGINRISPNSRFSVIDSLTNKGDRIFLVNNENKKSKLISTSKIELNKTGWTDDSEYLIFSTLGISLQNNKLRTQGKSKLYIYNIKDDKITPVGSDEGFKNFLIRGDLVIFDDGFNMNSKINIYNIKENKIINSISVKGGCGINRIPSIAGRK